MIEPVSTKGMEYFSYKGIFAKNGCSDNRNLFT